MQIGLGQGGIQEVRWGCNVRGGWIIGYSRTGKDGRWLWTGILKSATASSSLSVKSQESRPSANADSRQSLSNLYGPDWIESGPRSDISIGSEH